LLHATLTRWRSVGVATARAEEKSFVARGMTEQGRGKVFLSGRSLHPCGREGQSPLVLLIFMFLVVVVCGRYNALHYVHVSTHLFI